MKRLRIVSVHGTFDNEKNDQSPRWWQENSVFANKLRSRLLGHNVETKIIPFKWSGANSGLEREYAAVALKRSLRNLRQDDYDTYIVGHSHGGNVIEEALQRLSSRSQRKVRLIGVSSVGTPFLKRSVSLWRRAGLAGC